MSKTTSQITVRPAQAADLPACVQIDHALESSHVWQMAQREEGDMRHFSFQTLRLPRPIAITYPRSAANLELELAPLKGVLVAEGGQVILGYVHLTNSKADRTSWIRNLAVNTPWRRRRIASLLLSQAKEWAQLHHASYLMLETTTRNYPAIQFALGNGMQFCGFNDRYYPSQDIAIFFGLNL